MLAMPCVAATVAEVIDETTQLLDGFLVGLLALLDRSFFSVAQDTGFRVTAGPGNQ